MSAVTMRSVGTGVIIAALLSLNWAGAGVPAVAPGPLGAPQPATPTDESGSAATGTTLFSHLSAGLRSLVPFASSAAPAAAAIGADTTIVHRSDTAVTRRGGSISTRRVAPVRSAEEIAPRGIQVMQIAVPASLEGREAIDWVVQTEPTVSLLSATAGSVPQNASGETRAATVVVRVPGSAAAGVLPVGELTFATGTDAVVVPLELVVARIRRAVLTPVRPTFAGVSGHPAVLALDLTNLGNALDTFAIRTEALEGWAPTTVPAMILRPGERRRFEITVHIPAITGTTAAYPVVRAYVGDREVATSTLYMNVTSADQISQSPGPDLAVSAASVLGDSIGASPVFGFDLRGSVGRGINVMGRAAIATDPSDVNYIGLSRAGIFLGGAYLSATAPSWNATVGMTGTTISDLTGVGVFGVGASGGVKTGSIRTSAIVVNSQQAMGPSVGGRVERAFGKADFALAGSHLEDGFIANRTLDAVGLAAAVSPVPGMKLNGEVAWRSFTGGEGVGARVAAQHTSDGTFASVAVGHSPGGTGAYGRATDEANVAVSRRVNNWMALRADGYTSTDKPAAGGVFASSGFALAPAFALPHGATLETEVRRNDYNSTHEGLGFGNNETQLNGTLRGQIQSTRWRLGGSYASGSRTSDDGFLNLHSSQDYRRAGVAGGAGWTFRRVGLDVGADYSRSEIASGYFPRQLRLAATANRIQLFNDPRLPVLGASVEYTSWFSEVQKPVVVARVGTETKLAQDLYLLVDVERNPLIRPVGSPTPWVAAIRLTKSTRLGWAFSEPRTRGLVYQDANANGRRDAGEAGMQGVMVRRGTATAITDASGRWAFSGHDGNAPTVDPVSLPIGQVVGADSGAKVAGSELAVIPTAPLTIRLQPIADSLGRLPVGKLDQLVVLARDESGNEWSLRPDTLGMVTFDALPPGRYTLGADFSGSTERLRISGDAPVVEVRAGVTLETVLLHYQLRPVRVFSGAATGRSGR